MRLYLLLGLTVLVITCGNKSVSSDVEAEVHQGTPTGNIRVSGSPTPQTRKEVGLRENSIYSFLLTELVFGKKVDTSSDDLVVIQEKTFLSEEAITEIKNSGIEASLLADFKKKNSVPVELKRSFDVYFDYRFAVQANTDPTSEGFSQSFPKAKGLLRLSRIGINEELNQALVYSEFAQIDGKIERSFWLIRFKDGEMLDLKQFGAYK